MKIVIAPDSFKESLSALNVANAIEKGFKEIFPEAEYIKCPMADGGEGSLITMVEASGGSIISTEVTNPNGERVQSYFGLSLDKKTAFIEMATASGLELISQEKRNPLYATSFGTGELIRKALDYGATHFIIGIGGSATNDGGAGMLQALGVDLLDIDGKSIPRGGCGLASLKYIDITHFDPRISQCSFQIACDVTNPLLGRNGASYIFGPQKGATSEMVIKLDKNLQNFSKVIYEKFNVDVSGVAGGGAAGGLGAAFLAFFNAELKPGFSLISESLNLESKIKDAHLVITGEGRIDSQTVNGKVPTGVARIAKKYDVPVIAISGVYGEGFEMVYSCGIDAVFSILNKVEPLDFILKNAEKNIYNNSRNIAALMKISFNLKGNLNI